MIRQKYTKNIVVDKKKIKEELLKDNNKKEFNLSEIIFTINEGENLNTKLDKIIKEINKNGFGSAALLFSISDSSKDGGSIGWIKKESLNKEIVEILDKQSLNTISQPIRITSGFLILQINDIRTISVYENLDEEIELVLKSQSNSQLSQFSNILIEKLKKQISIRYEK